MDQGTQKQLVYNLFIDHVESDELDFLTKFCAGALVEGGGQKDFHLGSEELEALDFSQRVLLLSYLYLYLALKHEDIVINDVLSKKRDALGVKPEYAYYMFKSLKGVDQRKIIAGKSKIESVLDPNDYTFQCLNSLIYKIVDDGSFERKINIPGLNSREYEHHFDRDALNALKKTPGLKNLVEAVNKYGIDYIFRLQHAGSNFKVTENSVPDIYRVFRDACEILDVKKIPDLYVQNGFINAYTTCVDNPIVVLTSGSVSLLNHDELMFVLGHELGHIKSKHVMYHQMSQIFPVLADLLSSVTLGLGGLASSGVQIALLNWQRMSEFTSDRAGLLACQNLDASMTAMMKIAGYPIKHYKIINPDHFKRQAEEFEGFDATKMGKIAKLASVMSQSHPWTVMRGKELNNWVKSGSYGKILKRETQLPETQMLDILKEDMNSVPESATGSTSETTSLNKGEKFCKNCGGVIPKKSKFCKHCGGKVE